MHNQIQVKAGAQDVLANIARSIRFFDGAFKLSPRQGQFTTHINKGYRNTASITGDDHTFDQFVRVLLHDHAVFECARLAFISITAEVARLVVLGEKAPLHAGGEPGATPPAPSYFLNHL